MKQISSRLKQYVLMTSFLLIYLLLRIWLVDTVPCFNQPSTRLKYTKVDFSSLPKKQNLKFSKYGKVVFNKVQVLHLINLKNIWQTTRHQIILSVNVIFSLNKDSWWYVRKSFILREKKCTKFTFITLPKNHGFLQFSLLIFVRNG